MIKHLRYFLSPFSLLVAIFAVLKGNYYPLFFIILFDVLIELGDTFLYQDDKPFDNPVPSILNTALYINLPLLLVFVFLVLCVGVFSNSLLVLSDSLSLCGRGERGGKKHSCCV